MNKQTNSQSKSVIQQLAIFCTTMFFIAAAYAHEQAKVVVVPLEGDDLHTIYEIGKTGPAGGIVFHITDGGRHGLEAAPVNQSEGVDWCISSTDIASVDNLATKETVDPNTGAHNTAAIIPICGASSAAGVANSYAGPNGITTGWYLPNKEELNLLYLQKEAGTVGGFGKDVYWSSSEDVSNNAWVQLFDSGFQAGGSKDVVVNKVRAVRAF